MQVGEKKNKKENWPPAGNGGGTSWKENGNAFCNCNNNNNVHTKVNDNRFHVFHERTNEGK